jgi:hypothetical protein
MKPDDTTPTAPATPRVRRVSLPGGSARVAGEVRLTVAERPEEELVLQALERGDAAPLLRLGYRRGDRMIRGPVSATSGELLELLRLARADDGLAAVLPA